MPAKKEVAKKSASPASSPKKAVTKKNPASSPSKKASLAKKFANIASGVDVGERKSKKTEKYEPETHAVEHKAVKAPNGKGTALDEYPGFMKAFRALNKEDPELARRVAKILFGQTVVKADLLKVIGTFKGTGSRTKEEKTKATESANKLTVDNLHSVLRLFELPVSGKKEDLVERFLDFIEKPSHPEGKTVTKKPASPKKAAPKKAAEKKTEKKAAPKKAETKKETSKKRKVEESEGEKSEGEEAASPKKAKTESKKAAAAKPAKKAAKKTEESEGEKSEGESATEASPKSSPKKAAQSPKAKSPAKSSPKKASPKKGSSPKSSPKKSTKKTTKA